VDYDRKLDALHRLPQSVEREKEITLLEWDKRISELKEELRQLEVAKDLFSTYLRSGRARVAVRQPLIVADNRCGSEPTFNYMEMRPYKTGNALQDLWNVAGEAMNVASYVVRWESERELRNFP
jgi:hypothetical protein